MPEVTSTQILHPLSEHPLSEAPPPIKRASTNTSITTPEIETSLSSRTAKTGTAFTTIFLVLKTMVGLIDIEQAQIELKAQGISQKNIETLVKIKAAISYMLTPAIKLATYLKSDEGKALFAKMGTYLKAAYLMFAALSGATDIKAAEAYLKEKGFISQDNKIYAQAMRCISAALITMGIVSSIFVLAGSTGGAGLVVPLVIGGLVLLAKAADEYINRNNSDIAKPLLERLSDIIKQKTGIKSEGLLLAFKIVETIVSIGVIVLDSKLLFTHPPTIILVIKKISLIASEINTYIERNHPEWKEKIKGTAKSVGSYLSENGIKTLRSAGAQLSELYEKAKSVKDTKLMNDIGLKLTAIWIVIMANKPEETEMAMSGS